MEGLSMTSEITADTPVVTLPESGQPLIVYKRNRKRGCRGGKKKRERQEKAQMNPNLNGSTDVATSAQVASWLKPPAFHFRGALNSQPLPELRVPTFQGDHKREPTGSPNVSNGMVAPAGYLPEGISPVVAPHRSSQPNPELRVPSFQSDFKPTSSTQLNGIHEAQSSWESGVRTVDELRAALRKLRNENMEISKRLYLAQKRSEEIKAEHLKRNLDLMRENADHYEKMKIVTKDNERLKSANLSLKQNVKALESIIEENNAKDDNRLRNVTKLLHKHTKTMSKLTAIFDLQMDPVLTKITSRNSKARKTKTKKTETRTFVIDANQSAEEEEASLWAAGIAPERDHSPQPVNSVNFLCLPSSSQNISVSPFTADIASEPSEKTFRETRRLESKDDSDGDYPTEKRMRMTIGNEDDVDVNDDFDLSRVKFEPLETTTISHPQVSDVGREEVESLKTLELRKNVNFIIDEGVKIANDFV